MMKKLAFLIIFCLGYQSTTSTMQEENSPGLVQKLSSLNVSLDSLAKLLGEGGEEPLINILLEKPIIYGEYPIIEECPIIKGDKKIDQEILKVVENTTQLKVSAIGDSQASSGYISAYYALESLARILNKPVTISFEDFKTAAERLVKKYRIRVACRNLIESILLQSLVKENELESIKLTQTSWNNLEGKEYLRTVYRHFLGDLADIQAWKFIKEKYKDENDTLISSEFFIEGEELITALIKKENPLIAKKKKLYIERLMNQGQQARSAFFNTIINNEEYLNDFTKISNKTLIKINANDVLEQLHKKDNFDIEEGAGGTAMPKGLYLRSDDIEGLITKCFLNSFGLMQKDIHLHIFDDLNLIQVPDNDLTTETLQNKKEFNQVTLTSLAEKKNITHIFIVNNAFNYENPNASLNTFNWIMILRKANNEYIIVDPENKDILESPEVTSIKEAFSK